MASRTETRSAHGIRLSIAILLITLGAAVLALAAVAAFFTDQPLPVEPLDNTAMPDDYEGPAS